MGIKNAVSKTYLQDGERFAQIWNNHVFGGEQIICPEHLRELDPEELAVMGRKLPDVGIAEKRRDILKVYDDKTILMLLGVENQAEISNAMPLRQMLYDVLRYETQRAELEKGHKEKQDLQGAEFLSGMTGEDRLLPVLSLVVYWGSKPWDGAKSLHEMLDIPDVLTQYKSIINDYHMTLLEVNAIENLDAYNGELKALLGFVKYQKDKEELKAFVYANEDIFRKVSKETVRAISVLGNGREMSGYFSTEEENEEVVDMCQALQDMILEGREEGKAEGRAQGRAETILDFLNDLGNVSETLQTTILNQRDLSILKEWVKLAARAASVEEFAKRIS